MALGKPGSLRLFMDALVAVEETVHPDLRVYRWRPRTIELPAIYNWVPDAPFEQRDLTRFRDTLTVLSRVAVRHSDVDDEMVKVEEYADAFRERLDAEFHQNQPLEGAATRVIRTGMGTVLDTFNEIDVLCVEFRSQAQLDRLITPS